MFTNCQEKYWTWIKYLATESIRVAPKIIMIQKYIFSRKIGMIWKINIKIAKVENNSWTV